MSVETSVQWSIRSTTGAAILTAMFILPVFVRMTAPILARNHGQLVLVRAKAARTILCHDHGVSPVGRRSALRPYARLQDEGVALLKYIRRGVSRHRAADEHRPVFAEAAPVHREAHL